MTADHPNVDAITSTPADPWSWQRFAILLGLVIGVYALYFPLNVLTVSPDAHKPILPIDTATPLIPVWIFAYVYIYPAVFMPAVVVAHSRLFVQVIKAYLLVEVIALLTFALYPVNMVLRPEDLAPDSFTSWGVRVCYFIDQPSACLPSLHVGLSTLAALATRKADRLVGNLGLLAAVLIGASTMLIKQHYFADVAAGMFLAMVSYRIFVHDFDASKWPPEPLRRSRWAPVGLVLTYVAAMIGCYIAYRTGWAPWEAV